MAEIHYSDGLNSIFLQVIESELENVFDGCNSIAVKLHFGEPENPYTFTPRDIEPFTEILQNLSKDFFLTDSPVAYGGPRGSADSYEEMARQSGWDEIGQVRISKKYTDVGGKYLDYEVCSEPGAADGVLVINHFKGHICSGIGGAIKNLGMGGLSITSKNAIHDGGSPEIVGICNQCLSCEEVCPVEAITIYNEPEIDRNLCIGCSKCIRECPEAVLEPAVNYFDELLADGANTAQSTYKKYYNITVVRDIARECDCEPHPTKVIARDIGYLAGIDPVAIDQAAHDLVVESEGRDVFLQHNHKTGIEQVLAAERLGMGSTAYTLQKH